MKTILRSNLSIIPQEPILFTGTLRNNLDQWGKHDDSKLWDIVKKSHLSSLVGEDAAGLDMKITEGGSNLSVGQRQLVCLGKYTLYSRAN